MANEYDFFADLGARIEKAAREMGDLADDFIGTQKIRTKILQEQRNYDKHAMAVGKILYEKYVAGQEVDADILPLCLKMQKAQEEIDKCKAASSSKASDSIACEACGAQVPKGAHFCMACGARLDQEEASATEEDAATETAEEAASVEATAEAADRETTEEVDTETTVEAPLAEAAGEAPVDVAMTEREETTGAVADGAAEGEA